MIDPTIAKVLTGAGLLAGYHAGLANQESRNESFFERTRKETGILDKDKIETDPIFKAHLKTTQDKPTITTDEEGSGYVYKDWDKQEGKIIDTDKVQLQKDPSRYILAHELGHREARFGENPIERTAQNKMYQGVSPLIRSPALIALGYASPSSRRALAYGLAANYLNFTPMLISENAANRHAQKYMKETGQPVDRSLAREQLRNYGLGVGIDAIGHIGGGMLIKGLADNPHTKDYVRSFLHLDDIEKGGRVAKEVGKEAFNYLKHKVKELW